MKRLAFALVALLLGTFSALAAPCAGIAGSMFGGFCIPFHALADPATGLPLGTAANPLFVTGGSGGSSGPAAQGAPNGGGAAAWYVQWANQSLAVSSLPSLPAGSNTIGAVNVLGGDTTALKVDGSGVHPARRAGRSRHRSNLLRHDRLGI